jgi:hypothetical protein
MLDRIAGDYRGLRWVRAPERSWCPFDARRGSPSGRRGFDLLRDHVHRVPQPIGWGDLDDVGAREEHRWWPGAA